MLNQIKALLQDGQLRQKIKAAKTLDEAIKLIITEDAEKGDNFTTEDVTQMLTKLEPGTGNKLIELSESDLLGVAGGFAGLTLGTCTRCRTCRACCGNYIITD